MCFFLPFCFLLVVGGTKDSQNVDLFSGTENAHLKTMKRNKSADDVLSPGVLHGEEEFFNPLGSHSASSSRDNISSFTAHSSESATFDPFNTTRANSSGNTDDLFASDSQKTNSPDLFDPFSSKSSVKKPMDEFDLFGLKEGRSKSSSSDPASSPRCKGSAESFGVFGGGESTTNSEMFDPFGSKPSQTSRSTQNFQPFASNSFADRLGGKPVAASEDLFGMTTTAKSSNSIGEEQPKDKEDLFGDWGDTTAIPLQPNRASSPNLSRKANGAVPQSKSTPSDPFADFGNLKSNLPQSASTAPKFQIPNIAPTKKPEPQSSANASWSRSAQQPVINPSSPKAQRKPNYTPTYSTSSSSSVFGSYGQKWNGE